MDTHFDRLRHWIEGSMPAAERARFESELAQDPALARLAQEMRLVWSATSPGLGAAAASNVTLDDIVARDRLRPIERDRRWQRAAAAVVLIAGAAAATWFVARHHGSAPDHAPAPNVVRLNAIPIGAATPLPAPETPIPAVLASWAPVENGQIRWLHSMDEARAVSAAVDRPIFVYGYVDGCPICAGFQANEFKDPAIQSLVTRSVPVAIDLMSLGENERNQLWNRRYPLLELQDDRGEVMRTFAGMFAEVDMQAELANALHDVTAPPWQLVRDLAEAWQRATAAEEAGKLGAAAGEFTKLARQHDVPVFAAHGEHGLAEIGSEASSALDHVRTLAETDPKAARAALDADIERFAGTPYEDDLRSVSAGWGPAESFPDITR